ncbi:MAG TPA: hypothetical protein VGF16_01475 [Bryobacteraceae bacterium]|jgi:hypothetical protein
MHLTMTYFDGRRVEGVVLAVSAERIRISIPGQEDAMELTLRQSVWVTEDQEPVEIEALVVESDLSLLFADMQPGVRTARAVS